MLWYLAEARTRAFDPNASRADLMGRNLRSRWLCWADLRGAYLIAADLRDSDLSDVDLLGADLRDARLEGADLSKALHPTQARASSGFQPEKADQDWRVRSRDKSSGSSIDIDAVSSLVSLETAFRRARVRSASSAWSEGHGRAFSSASAAAPECRSSPRVAAVQSRLPGASTHMPSVQFWISSWSLWRYSSTMTAGGRASGVRAFGVAVAVPAGVVGAGTCDWDIGAVSRGGTGPEEAAWAHPERRRARVTATTALVGFISGSYALGALAGLSRPPAAFSP
ncbi:pentapeptide repeat-containing protein [Arthrobacter pascens]|nr:pentapeptide repeat-containing protein [Arthrobacter pascens]